MKLINQTKALCQSDDFLNKYFIVSSDILEGHIIDLFNIYIYFTEILSKGCIMLLHKKRGHAISF
jgi:hypothetical protein